ncbi:hypothetical protein DSO57_1025059 [Entomophthora muscae]|uniref:Uncharacterized protein n=1 Tax=Entomophthora muscae TaxID=34485 RepID=A0ACC2TPW8_9FUNG|nr:hypothetical protein DSO57_1025059 [Entomophthora muscae]
MCYKSGDEVAVKVMKIFVLLSGALAGLTEDLAVAFTASRYKVGIRPIYPSYALEYALSTCLEWPFIMACQHLQKLKCPPDDNVVYYFAYGKLETYVKLCDFPSTERVIDYIAGSTSGRDLMFSNFVLGCQPVNIVAGARKGNDTYVVVSRAENITTSSLRPVYFPNENCVIRGMEEFVIPLEDKGIYDLYDEVNAIRAEVMLPPFEYSHQLTSRANAGFIYPQDLLCSRNPDVSCRKPDSTGCTAYEVLKLGYAGTDTYKIAQQFFNDPRLPAALKESYRPNQWLAIGFRKTHHTMIWVAYASKCRKLCKRKPHLRI